MIDTHYHGDDDVIVENIGDVYHPKVGRLSGDIEQQCQIFSFQLHSLTKLTAAADSFMHYIFEKINKSHFI